MIHRIVNLSAETGFTALARWWSRRWRDDDGQDLLEYGLLMALIAIVALGAVQAVGNAINTVFWQSIAAAF